MSAVINFGRKHRGHTYSHVATTDPAYLYHSTGNRGQVAFRAWASDYLASITSTDALAWFDHPVGHELLYRYKTYPSLKGCHKPLKIARSSFPTYCQAFDPELMKRRYVAGMSHQQICYQFLVDGQDDDFYWITHRLADVQSQKVARAEFPAFCWQFDPADTQAKYLDDVTHEQVCHYLLVEGEGEEWLWVVPIHLVQKANEIYDLYLENQASGMPSQVTHREKIRTSTFRSKGARGYVEWELDNEERDDDGLTALDRAWRRLNLPHMEASTARQVLEGQSTGWLRVYYHSAEEEKVVRAQVAPTSKTSSSRWWWAVLVMAVAIRYLM